MPPVISEASDSRPEPVMPATPTISPGRTSKSSPRTRSAAKLPDSQDGILASLDLASAVSDRIGDTTE